MDREHMLFDTYKQKGAVIAEALLQGNLQRQQLYLTTAMGGPRQSRPGWIIRSASSGACDASMMASSASASLTDSCIIQQSASHQQAPCHCRQHMPAAINNCCESSAHLYTGHHLLLQPVSLVQDDARRVEEDDLQGQHSAESISCICLSRHVLPKHQACSPPCSAS